MTREIWFLLFAIIGAIACGASNAGRLIGAEADSENSPQQQRIGIYDSRAVAVAYCDTKLHKSEISRLDEALKKAKTTGNAAKIKQADRANWEQRKRLHRQGFSTYPVDDILNKMSAEIKRIKEENKLQALVSKWDEKTLANYKQAEQVDVTEQLINALAPNDRQRRNAMEMMKVPPIPPKEFEKHLKEEAGEHY